MTLCAPANSDVDSLAMPPLIGAVCPVVAPSKKNVTVPAAGT